MFHPPLPQFQSSVGEAVPRAIRSATAVHHLDVAGAGEQAERPAGGRRAFPARAAGGCAVRPLAMSLSRERARTADTRAVDSWRNFVQLSSPHCAYSIIDILVLVFLL